MYSLNSSAQIRSCLIILSFFYVTIVIIIANITYSFVKYSLHTNYMPGTVLDIGNKAMDTTKSQPLILRGSLGMYSPCLLTTTLLLSPQATTVTDPEGWRNTYTERHSKEDNSSCVWLCLSWKGPDSYAWPRALPSEDTLWVATTPFNYQKFTLILCKSDIMKHMNEDMIGKIKRRHGCVTLYGICGVLHQRSQLLHWIVGIFPCFLIYNFPE